MNTANTNPAIANMTLEMAIIIDGGFSARHGSKRFVELETALGQGTPVRLPGFPVKLARTPPTLRRAPPHVGQHNEDILSEFGLGADPEARAALVA